MHVRFKANELARVLRTVSMFASKDAMRPHLNAVRMELVEDDRILFAATDGHCLATWVVHPMEIVAKKRDTGITIPLREANLLLATLKPYGRGDSFHVDVRTVAKRAEVWSKSGVNPSAAVLLDNVSATFPPIRSIVPKPHAASVPVTLNAALISNVYKAFTVARPGKAPVAVRAFANDPLGPIVFRAEHDDLHELTVIAMPMRSMREVTWCDLPNAVVAPAAAPKAPKAKAA